MRTQLRDDAPRPDALLNLDEVCHFFGGLDPSTIYRNIRRGVFPAPIRVSPNTSRWLRRECEAALAAMIDRRGAQ
jgi:predicted DNA-binding transcriptional regulator AlpA